MYIRENNQESILAYMDYINKLFFFFILEYINHIISTLFSISTIHQKSEQQKSYGGVGWKAN